MVQWSTSGSSPDLSTVAVLSTAKRFEDQSTLGLSLLELKCGNRKASIFMDNIR